MDKILLKIDTIITLYNSGAFISKEDLLRINKELSFNMYLLTKENIEAFNDWTTIIHNEDSSVAKATVKANKEVPELRMTRKILEACKGVSIQINNEIQIIKNDR